MSVGLQELGQRKSALLPFSPQGEEAGLWEQRMHSEKACAHEKGRVPLLGGLHQEWGSTTIKASLWALLGKNTTTYRTSLVALQ